MDHIQNPLKSPDSIYEINISDISSNGLRKWITFNGMFQIFATMQTDCHIKQNHQVNTKIKRKRKTKKPNQTKILSIVHSMRLKVKTQTNQTNQQPHAFIIRSTQAQV